MRPTFGWAARLCERFSPPVHWLLTLIGDDFPPWKNWSLFWDLTVSGLTRGSIYALIALGYSMVYGILKLLNFAHGDVYMIGAFVGLVRARRASGGPTSPLDRRLVRRRRA